MATKSTSHKFSLLHQIAKMLNKKNQTLGVCESCTGGMLGSIITAIPGSSKYFLGGIIAYSNKVKQKIVGIKEETVKQYGAVSAETAYEMVKGIIRKFKSDFGMAITGIAGPSGGTKKKPVGLVFIALADKKRTIVLRYLFKGSREAIRKKACRKALLLLNYFLYKKESR